MTHITAEYLNGVVDVVLSRITSAEATLVPPGQNLTVIEGDEEPQYIKALPSVYVIPLGEGGDSITSPQQADEGGLTHNFSVTVCGFYRYKDISSGMRATRTFGYNALDLFVGDNQLITAYSPTSSVFYGALTVDAKVKVGYRRDKDFVIHAWILTLNLIGT